MKHHTLFLSCLPATLLVPATIGHTAEGPEHPDHTSRGTCVLEGVTELDKPVSFSEGKSPLVELVGEVAAETGVTLVAAPGVADEPVAAFVTEIPARELLEQLADLLDYQWARHGKTGEWRYQIWQDLASRQREAALRQGAFAGVEKQLREQMGQLAEMAALPPAEIERLAQEYDSVREGFFKLPYPQRMLVAPQVDREMRRRSNAQKLVSPVNRSLLGLLRRLTPAQWSVLRAGQPLTFSTDPRPGELPLSSEMSRTFQSARPSMETGPPPGDPAQVQQERQRRQEREGQWATATGYLAKVRLDSDDFARSGSITLAANAVPLQESVPLWSPDGGPEGTSLWISAERVQTPAQEEEMAGTPERNAALEQDPVLGAKRVVKHEPKPGARPGEPGWKSFWTIPEMLPDLARTYGISLIADAYATDEGGFGFPGAEPIPLYLFLDRWVGIVYRWDQKGKLIRLRNREWFFSRPKEVPLRLLRRWEALCDRDGTLPLDECVAAVTSLNDDQLESADHLLQQHVGITGRPLYLQLFFARHGLRLYAALAPGQRQALWQGQPVPAAQMTPAQRALFLEAIQDIERSQRRDPASRLISLPPNASFSMTSERLIRVTQRGPDATTAISAEPAPPAEPARLPAATAQVSGSPLAAAGPQAVTRQPMTDLTFELFYGAEPGEQERLSVASLR